MGEVIDLAEAFGVDVAVHLRRRERAVPEQLLDRAQVGAALQQVRGEGVAQPVRVRDEPPERRRVEPLAARREEERVLCAACELRSRLAQVARDERCRLLAEWDDAILPALPLTNVHVLLLEIDVSKVETDGLGGPQAGRVDELEESDVTEPERSLGVDRVDDRLHLALL